MYRKSGNTTEALSPKTDLNATSFSCNFGAGKLTNVDAVASLLKEAYLSSVHGPEDVLENRVG